MEMNIPDGYVMVFHLIKNKALSLNFTNGGTKTFAPAALVQKSQADKLLKKQITIGGCCGKPSRTVYLFASDEQLKSGEREWIT